MLPSELKAAIDDAYRNAAQQPRLIAEEGEILTSEFEISLQVLCAAIQTGKYPIATYHAQAEIVRVSREIARRFGRRPSRLSDGGMPLLPGLTYE